MGELPGDDLCTSFQDCCFDVCDTCNICGDPGSELSNTCDGFCGLNAGLCWCKCNCIHVEIGEFSLTLAFILEQLESNSSARSCVYACVV